MNKTFEQFIQKAKNIALSKKENLRAKESLLVFMENNPVRNTAMPRLHYQRSSSVLQLFFKRGKETNLSLSHLLFNLRPMPIAIAIILLITGGVSYGAQSALPGDTLYALKVHFNEGVRSALTFSPSAKAAWETELAKHRLEEAEQLAIQGKLDTPTQQNLQEQFRAHISQVFENLHDLKGEQNIQAVVEVNSNLESLLNAHENVLVKIRGKGEKKDAIGSLEISLKEQAEQARDERRQTENELFTEQASTTVKVFAEGKLNAALHKIEEVSRFIDQAKVSEQVRASARARLQDAQDLVAQGKAKMNAGAYGEAFIRFQEAMGVAQEAKLLVKAQQDLDLDIDVRGFHESSEHGPVKNDDKDEGQAHDKQEQKDRELELQGKGGVHLDF